MKWYNFETVNRGVKEALTAYLKAEKIYHEVSGAGIGWHFEIKTDADGLTKVNKWLDDYYTKNPTFEVI